MSVFEKAEKKAKRLKLYLFGPSGVGKTVFALHFPNPAVIDAERGTDFYGGKFDFMRIQTADPTVIEPAIDELLKDPGDLKTLIIDPFTVVYEEIGNRHLRRMRTKKNNPNYDLQPLDYKSIKAELKLLVNKLLALDLNVIVTSRSKRMYAEGEFMKIIGQQADGPDSMPYMFDVVMEAFLDKDGNRMARIIKDRTNTLPYEFELNYKMMTQYFGIDGLEREPVVFDQERNIAELSGRSFKTDFQGREILTAGVTGPQLNSIKKLVDTLGEKEVLEILKDDYKVDKFLDLREDEAALFIKTLEEK